MPYQKLLTDESVIRLRTYCDSYKTWYATEYYPGTSKPVIETGRYYYSHEMSDLKKILRDEFHILVDPGTIERAITGATFCHLNQSHPTIPPAATRETLDFTPPSTDFISFIKQEYLALINHNLDKHQATPGRGPETTEKDRTKLWKKHSELWRTSKTRHPTLHKNWMIDRDWYEALLTEDTHPQLAPFLPSRQDEAPPKPLVFDIRHSTK